MVVGRASTRKESPVVLDHSLPPSTAKYVIMIVSQGILSGLEENSSL